MAISLVAANQLQNTNIFPLSQAEPKHSDATSHSLIAKIADQAILSRQESEQYLSLLEKGSLEYIELSQKLLCHQAGIHHLESGLKVNLTACHLRGGMQARNVGNAGGDFRGATIQQQFAEDPRESRRLELQGQVHNCQSEIETLTNERNRLNTRNQVRVETLSAVCSGSWDIGRQTLNRTYNYDITRITYSLSSSGGEWDTTPSISRDRRTVRGVASKKDIWRQQFTATIEVYSESRYMNAARIREISTRIDNLNTRLNHLNDELRSL